MQMSEYLRFDAERSVYGSLNGLLSTQRRSALGSSDGITISKRIANTCKKNLAPSKHRVGNFFGVVWGAIRRNKNQRPHGQLRLLRQANVAKAPFSVRCWMNLPPIRLKVV
eukprot:343562_1